MHLGLNRVVWVRALTTAGWCLLLGYLGILAINIDRAGSVTRSQFNDGIWGQRVEILSFSSIPQHLVVLGLGAAAAVVAAVVASASGYTRDVWLDRLVRTIAGTAMAAILLSAVGIIWVIVAGNESIGDFNFVISRAAGAAVGVAIVRVCLVVERDDQMPSSPSR